MGEGQAVFLGSATTLLGVLISATAGFILQRQILKHQIKLRQIDFAHKSAKRKLKSLKSAYQEVLDAADSFYTSIRLCEHDDLYGGALGELLEYRYGELDPDHDPFSSAKSKLDRIMDWTPILDQARERFQRSIGPLLLERQGSEVIRLHAELLEDFDNLVGAVQSIMMGSDGEDEDHASRYEHNVMNGIEALKKAIQSDLDSAEHATLAAPPRPLPRTGRSIKLSKQNGERAGEPQS